MQRVIVFANPDDPTRVSVMTPTGELPIEELIRRHIDTSKPYAVMAPSDLPVADDDFFEAWSLVAQDNGSYSVQVDITKARELHRKSLRFAREPLLQQLDVAFMRAVERGDTAEQQSIAARKQRLRDSPTDTRIEAAQTTAELRALTLDVLTAYYVFDVSSSTH